MAFDLEAASEAYRRDGVVRLQGALDADVVAQALKAYTWSIDHPGPRASRVAQRDEGLFYQDLYHALGDPAAMEAYREVLQTSPIADIIALLWGSANVWFMYEQVFLKEGHAARRTPWHQDSSYLTVAGEDLAVMWITFDSMKAQDSLEFVRGSHRGQLYNGSRFDVDDDTLPLHETDAAPRLPDIEADRDRYDIVSWAVDPGDVIVFHPATLHGGAATQRGQRRRTLTLRFFGDRSYYDERPGPAGPPIAGFHRRLRQGDLFRDPAFERLRPRGVTSV
jgi:ectoine hydroxylase-related dioxygenase (phytanoyl-CoA dioxygenase family)